MDEIINNIIEIDKKAKNIFNEANNRNDNFDELVEDAIEKQKRIIDKEIEEKIRKIENIRDFVFLDKLY